MTRTATDWQFRKQIEAERAAHVAKHGPGCQICGTVPKTRGLQWDHDHRTGQTRGWLCHRCNRNLPTWVDPDWCLRAFGYLVTRPDGTTELPKLYQAYVQLLRGWLADVA
jgi:hypothetical protein